MVQQLTVHQGGWEQRIFNERVPWHIEHLDIKFEIMDGYRINNFAGFEGGVLPFFLTVVPAFSFIFPPPGFEKKRGGALVPKDRRVVYHCGYLHGDAKRETMIKYGVWLMSDVED